MEENSDRAYNELLMEVQQQILCYKEMTNERFQILEDLLAVAAQQVEIIQKKRAMKIKRAKENKKLEAANSVVKNKIIADHTGAPLAHLKLQFPRYTKASKVQEQVGRLLSGMTGLRQNQGSDEEEFTEEGDDICKEEDKEVSVNSQIIQQHIGVFRSPQHAAFERQKSDFNIRNNTDDFYQQQAFSLHYTKKTVTTGPTRVGAYSITCHGSSYTAPSNQSQPTEIKTSKARPLTFGQREERRQRGLCFYGDDKLTKGHECKAPQHFMMIAKIPKVEEYEGLPKYDEDPREGMECLHAKPIFDEDPREGIGCWSEDELILTALGGSNLHSSIFLQSEFGTSEGLEEPDIQESQHKNVPPENSNRHAGNNSNEKFELKGHSSFVDEKDIYNNLGNLPTIRMSAREYVYDLQTLPIIHKVPYLELNELKNSLNHLYGELKWTEVGSIYAANTCGLQLRYLRTASSYDLGGLASENHVFIFDPGGNLCC